MAAGTIGEAYVQIVPSTKGIKGKLESAFNNEGGNIGSKIGSKISDALKKSLKVGLAGLGAGLLGSLKIGAELEQQLGGAEAVFEKLESKYRFALEGMEGSTATLLDYSKTAFKDMGLSQNEFLQGANKMGSLFQGMGHSVTDSMKMSANYMQRASDVASIMGIDTTEALEAVSGAAKGNFTMMDNLGVAMNATTLEAYALSKGIKKSWNAMSNEEKTGLAYQMFMEKTAKYAKNYSNENDTLAGSFNTLKTGFSTLMGQLGQGEDITKTLDGLKETSKKFLTAVTDSLKSIGAQLPTVINELSPAFNELVNTFIPIAIPILTNAFSSIFGAVISNLPSLMSNLLAQIPTILGELGNAFMDADIGGKFGIAIVASFGAYKLGSKLAPILTSAFGSLNKVKLPAIGGAGSGIGAALSGLANGLKAFASPALLKGAAILGGVMVILSGAAWASIKIISNALPDLTKGLVGFNTINGGNLAKVGLGLVGLGAGLAAMVGGGLIDKLASLVGLDFGNTLKGIIEPINEVMAQVDVGSLERFSVLGDAMGKLAISLSGIKGIDNIEVVANSISSINNTVSQMLASGAGVEMYNMLSSGLNTLKTTLTGFSSINGENLVNVGNGLTSLGAGLAAITAGGVLDKLAGLVGADFGTVLKGLIDPIAQLMPTLTPEAIQNFSLLGNGLSALGSGFEKIKGFVNGSAIAESITTINSAVLLASMNGIDSYTSLSNKLTALSVGINKLNSMKLNASGITSQLTEVANKIKTLNNFNWSSAVSKMKTQAEGIGKAIGQGIAAGMTASKAQALSVVGTTMDELVAEAKRRAKINSPSRVFRDEVGYWIGAGVGVGMPKGLNDYLPKTLDTLKSTLSSYETPNSSSPVFPDTFRIVDGNLEMIIKAEAKELITRNNVDYKLI